MEDTIFNYSKLNGRVKEKCGTQASFAHKMKLSERSICLKLSGRRDWKSSEIKRACDKNILDIPIEDIPIYFFEIKVQKREQNRAT